MVSDFRAIMYKLIKGGNNETMMGGKKMCDTLEQKEAAMNTALLQDRSENEAGILNPPSTHPLAF